MDQDEFILWAHSQEELVLEGKAIYNRTPTSLHIAVGAIVTGYMHSEVRTSIKGIR